MRAIWEGGGELPEDAAYWTKNNGELVGRIYVRKRAVRELARWARVYSFDERRATMTATVNSDAWMAQRSHMLVSAVLRDVVDHLITGL